MTAAKIVFDDYKWTADGPFVGKTCTGRGGECTNDALWVISPHGSNPSVTGIPLCGHHLAPVTSRASDIWEKAIVMQRIPKIRRMRYEHVKSAQFDEVNAAAAEIRREAATA